MGDARRSTIRDWTAAGRFLGRSYLRYSFTRGTAREVEFLVEALDLRPGARVLDVGCGPGRHAVELADEGIAVVGVDLSVDFVTIAAATAPSGAAFGAADARALPFPAAFDAVISICQGGFGLLGGDDERALTEIARVLRPGGRLALTALSSYFLVHHLEERDSFDAATGVNTEVTELRNEHGATSDFELVTTCFTPRELRLLGERAGLSIDAIWSVAPSDYARRDPDLHHPELLMVARKPGGTMI